MYSVVGYDLPGSVDAGRVLLVIVLGPVAEWRHIVRVCSSYLIQRQREMLHPCFRRITLTFIAEISAEGVIYRLGLCEPDGLKEIRKILMFSFEQVLI